MMAEGMQLCMVIHTVAKMCESHADDIQWLYFSVGTPLIPVETEAIVYDVWMLFLQYLVGTKAL